ncbi:DUF2628 domain-containing protein [Lactobacillaceae bacterium Melli_B4]
MHASLTNDQTGQVKKVKVGYSWTFMFFTFFVALIRGDWKTAIIAIIVWFVGLFAYGTLSAAFAIIYAFFYNKNYVNDLISDGYLPSSEIDKMLLLDNGYISTSTNVSKYGGNN